MQIKNLVKKNKTISLITGSGSGIGKYIALNIPDSHDLILISKTKKCYQVLEKIKKKNNPKVFAKQINFEKEIKIKEINILKKIKNYEKINLILCAGMIDPIEKKTASIKTWKKLYNVNFFSQIQIINQIIPLILKNIEVKIFFFSGGGAANSFPKFPIYSSTKTSIVRFVENFSNIYKKNKLTILAVAPGAVKTRMLKKVLKVAKVGKRSSLNTVYKFLSYCLENNIKYLDGKLVHVRDDLNKVKTIKNINYLKLRRVE